MPRSLDPYTILITLLTPLVLAACGSGISQSDYNAVQAQNQQLKQQVASQQVQIDRLRGAIDYTVESDLLFPSGGYQVSPAGQQLISKFARKLAPTQEEKILVTGYTDNAKIGPALAQQGVSSNQILSEKRANSVMQYMISQGVNPNLVAAQGRGDADPVASNDTPAGRAQNRRVDLTLVAASAVPAQASATVGTVEFSGGSVAVGIGFSWGSGTLAYNGRVHHFKISGLTLAGLGISSVGASGEVSDLNNLADFNGTYALGGAGAAVGVGGSVAVLQNEHGVVMNIRSTKIGLHFQVGVGGATVTLLD
jgi:chemotaxis protein MotB